MSKVDELKKEIEELNRLKKEKIEELSKLATDEVCMSAYEFDRLNKENKAQKDEIEKLKHDLDEKISLRRSKEKKIYQNYASIALFAIAVLVMIYVVYHLNEKINAFDLTSVCP